MSRWPDITDHLDIDGSAYTSPHAYVHGTVTIGADSSVWPMAVIRGDEGEIRIGARTNIQDGCILHADFDAYLRIGDEVTLGHGAIVHGCTIEDGALIGVGAVVLNHAVIGAGAVVGARALVPEGGRAPRCAGAGRTGADQAAASGTSGPRSLVGGTLCCAQNAAPSA